MEHTNPNETEPRTRRRSHLLRFEIQSLDVWGNAEDGYEVNAAYSCGSFELYGRREVAGGDFYATDAAVRRAFARYLGRDIPLETSLAGIRFDFNHYPMTEVFYTDEPDKPVWHIFAEDTVEENKAQCAYWKERG
jgi:hypothetical protein